MWSRNSPSGRSITSTRCRRRSKARRPRAMARWRWCTTPEPCALSATWMPAAPTRPKPCSCSSSCSAAAIIPKRRPLRWRSAIRHPGADPGQRERSRRARRRQARRRSFAAAGRGARTPRRPRGAPMSRCSVAIGYEQQAGNQIEDAVRTEQQAMQLADGAGRPRSAEHRHGGLLRGGGRLDGLGAGTIWGATTRRGACGEDAIAHRRQSARAAAGLPARAACGAGHRGRSRQRRAE